MTIEWIGEGRSSGVDSFMAAADHPSKLLLDRTLAYPEDEAAWADLIDAYDHQAGRWSTWVAENPHYLDALRAVLERTVAPANVIEVCCGSGNATAMIAASSGRVLAVDASPAMLAGVPVIDNVTWRLADVRCLPAEDGAFDLVVGVNAVPWPPELARVCRPTGSIIWVASFGADTPLYIEPERLVEMLGPGWAGQAGTVGRGIWCQLTRA